MDHDYLRFYAGGEFHQSDSPVRLAIVNPATEEHLATVSDCDAGDTEKAVALAVSARISWAQLPNRERGLLIGQLGQLIRRDLDEIAELECRDIGRTLNECRAHVLRAAETCEYCAGYADKLEGRLIPQKQGAFAYTLVEPYGVVGAITPWNPALLHIIQKTSHALTTGNVIVIKLSPLACLSAYKLTELIEEAGFPPGVFNFVTGTVDAGNALITHPKIDLVSFTGSASVGYTVAGVAGTHGKPIHLELGGKAPAIIFADSDLDSAALDLASATFGSTGQSCTAPTRIFVERPVFEEFTAHFTNYGSVYKGRDPFSPDAKMGPLISQDARQRVLNLVEDAVNNGAKIVHGAIDEHLSDKGYFLDPMILSEVTDSARIFHEEVFGPVTCLYPFDDETEVIDRANSGPSGLAAGLYTESLTRTRRLVNNLRVGNVWINGYKKLDPALPFGGIKGSGFSRECGVDGLLAFTTPKAVVESFSN